MVNEIDNDIDTIDDGGDTEFAGMQDRMEGGDEAPWLSESDGQVYDGKGNLATDDDGKPYTSLDEYQQKPAATPAKQQKPAATPAIKTADDLIFGESERTPEAWDAIAATGNFQYAGELLPPVATPGIGQQPQQPAKDPIVALREERDEWMAVAVSPIDKIRDILVQNGADPEYLDGLLRPIRANQQKIVDSRYQGGLERTMLDKAKELVNPDLEKLRKSDISNRSSANVESLSRQYYPQSGKQGFFALLNGYNDETGKFIPGPASGIMDLFVKLSNPDKKFASQQELKDTYSNTFLNMTADPVMSKVMFDLVHNYWLGKNFKEGRAAVFNKGKQAGTTAAERAMRTFKTRPASLSQPAESSGLPGFLQELVNNS